MLIFYIILGCIIFAISSLMMQFDRLAIYRHRIIRHLAKVNQQTPFILSENQELQIEQCFLQAIPIKKCIKQLKMSSVIIN